MTANRYVRTEEWEKLDDPEQWLQSFLGPDLLRVGQLIIGEGEPTWCFIDNMGFMVSREEAWEIINAVLPFYQDVTPGFIEAYNEQHMESFRQTTNKSSTKQGPQEPASVKGHVYLLQSGPFYKIGASQHVTERVEQLGTQPPFDIELLHTISTHDMYSLEADLHKRFDSKRKNGEWFELEEEDIEYIKSLGGPNE